MAWLERDKRSATLSQHATGGTQRRRCDARPNRGVAIIAMI